ncbi:MAG TPA: alpha/beta fold hydrolase [Chloroflexia bacterium]
MSTAPRRFRLRRRALPPQPELDLEPFALGPLDSPIGCLLVHGFSGSPPEMRGLGAFLAERGARVEGVRLAGHGTRPEELKGLTWGDWLSSAEDGLARLQREGRRVVIIGFSMGGLLGLRLCAAHPEQVAGIVTISSPVYFRDRRIHLIPVVRHVVRWHNVRRPGAHTDPDAHTRYVSYRRYPLIAVDRLLNLIRTTRKLLPQVRTPALIMHGVRDRVIHPRSATYIYKHLSSPQKDLEWWHNSGHGVVFDTEREQVWQRVWTFVQSRTG